jgi:CheY-like chemotaxis protein
MAKILVVEDNPTNMKQAVGLLTALPSTPAPAVPRLEARAGARTALVVQNDVVAAALIRAQLMAEGFDVLHAASGEAALLLAVRQPLSLIALDILLPNMDGWQFLDRLNQLPELNHVPVVISSIFSDRDQGSAFGATAVLQKPISRQELHGALAKLGLSPRSPDEPIRVLVVDDDPKAVELIAIHMGGLAATVLRAHGGHEAIEAARRELPDLIFLDLLMPDVSGFDVIEALKDDSHTARIPIVVVTAKDLTAWDRSTLSGHVMAIMEKPGFDGARFIAEVRRAMSARGAAV